MIPADKRRWFETLFAWYCRRKIGRTFDSMRVRGLAGACDSARRAPLLIVSNHTAWWDPLVAFVLAVGPLEVDGHAMMDAANLARLPFFRKIGAFGVDRGDPRDGARAIRYAAKRLDGARRMVWVFAQGRERPITERPLGFLGGAAEIARIAPRAVVVPAALRYEHGEAERPTIWVSFGDPIASTRDIAIGRAQYEAAVTRELDRIDAVLRAGDGGEFEVALRGHRAPVFGAAQRALAVFTRR